MNGYCAILILLVVLSRPCICMKLVAKPTILEKKNVFWHIQIKWIQTILNVWKFYWEVIEICYEFKPCYKFAI